MHEHHLSIIARELEVGDRQVAAVGKLIDEGATVPFIARYRKEATGSLDEVAVTAIRDRLDQLRELDKRRESILKSLEERGLLTEDLKAKIAGAGAMTVLEDIYLPFRPKRRTRATVAREKGLEPLAVKLFEQDEVTDPPAEATSYVDAEKGVDTVEEALAGARDIIAEWINENQESREKMRALYVEKGEFVVKLIPGQEEAGAKFKDYFDWRELVATAPSHRVLAMRRGAKEGFLDLSVAVPEADALGLLEDLFVKGAGPASELVKEAVTDGFHRLLSVGMETEMRLDTKKRADDTAIRVFADNLRELLMASPLGQKTVLAIDPGIRTGCKAACLDRQGKLLHTDTVYLFKSQKEKARAARTLTELCERYRIEAIAIGNGTAGRETEAFVRGLDLPDGIQVVMVNESGASVYSASEAARQEFPDLDLTFRGAVSIGRRLMDPLAELVKIEPKSIGVGQYQHDVNQPALKRGLDDVVVSCVNGVGVEVNTASEQLLTYVSGLGPQLAGNIVAFRNDNGPLPSRKALKKVPRMGPKAFEQAAGFLRIRQGENPLDASAVHPESYGIVTAMAQDLGCSVKDLIDDSSLHNAIDLKKYVTEQAGLPTLVDIMAELAKPGRDPRARFESMDFAEGIQDMADLEKGMKLPGVVTNVTAFGAFVDVGVHQDGLVHISQLADRFVKDPAEVVKVNQRVDVTVLDVDLDRKRISLSMKKDPGERKTSGNGGKKAKPVKKQARKSDEPKNKPFNNPFINALK
ncbi:MAG: RNA-binding transcriptional accessory protein [Deltaproteobacteria bacterium]|nr:RNA-binding transcriptional accessory protein [Deltaproteobacteria bacterium]